MTQTVYVDVLWLINFCMDLLALGMTARLVQRKTTPLRICLAAACGGLWAVAALLGNIPGGIGFFCDGAVAILMLLIAFGGASLARMTVTVGGFFLVSFLLGGSMTALSRLFDGMRTGESGLRGGEFLLIALAGSGITLLCTRIPRRTQSVRHDVMLTLDGRSICFTGMEDSGNLIADPLSGRGVIFVAPALLRPLCTGRLGEIFLAQAIDRLPELKGREARRLRLLSGETVGGRRLMLALVPDAVTIGGEACPALICPGEIAQDAGCDAILPAVLSRTGKGTYIIGKELQP